MEALQSYGETTLVTVEMKNKDKRLVINPVFQPIFDDSLGCHRYYINYGGRGSGKSYATSIALVQLTYSKFKHKILYLRQTMASSEDSTVADIRQAIEDLGLAGDFRYKAGLFTNKRSVITITFKGIRSSGNNSAKLKSLSGITTLVIEEAEELESFEEFSKIDESIRVKGKPLKVMLVFTPTSSASSWIHKEWFDNGVPKIEREHDTHFMHTTYRDNLNNLDEGTVQMYEDLKERKPIYYQNVILAKWTTETEGRIYEGWGHYEEMEDEGDVWYGMDFGYGGKDRTSLIKINHFEGVYYVSEIFSKAKVTPRQMLTLMRKAGVPFNATIFGDYAMPLMLREIYDGGYRGIRKCLAKGKVEDGIIKVQNKRITIVGDDESHLMKGYLTWATNKKGLLTHEPDELAALRYGILSKVPNKNPKRAKPRAAIRTQKKGFI